MANRMLENEPKSKTSKNRLSLYVGVAGVILLVLGIVIPFQEWKLLLIWLGFILLFALAFSFRLWFIGDWIPTLLADNERGNKDDIPPPPTTGRWP